MTIPPFLQTIVDASETGLVVLDQERRVVLWNGWMAAMSGISVAEAMGAGFFDLFPEADKGRIALAITDALERGMSSIVSPSLHKVLLPLYKEGRTPGSREGITQVVVVKPLPVSDGPGRCMVQVSDVTGAASREQILRQQARAMEALAENYRISEVQIRAIVDNTIDAIVTFTCDGTISTYNPAAERIFGYPPPEIIAKNVGILMPGLAAGPSGLAAAAELFMGERREVLGLRKDGTSLPLELAISDMEFGGRRLFIAIARDITERKAAEEEVRTQKEWLSTLINAMPDIVCFKDGQNRWLIANDFYLRLFQLSEVDYRGLDADQLADHTLLYGGFLRETKVTDEQAWAEGRALSYENVIPTADGGEKIFDMSKIPLFNVDGSRKGLVVVGRDVTERRLAQQRIQHMAHHDSLTGLPNRVLFQERLRSAVAQARRGNNQLALMFLDLDKFKDVNDTLGHHVGDLLLKAVAKRLLRCVRETDTVARLGGDEFAIILTNLADADGASTVAEQIIKSIAEPFGLEDAEINTSTSVGITLFPSDGHDADEILRNADLALYRSKADGRNRYHFFIAEMNAEVQARKQIERDLRHALGVGELTMFYQPFVDLKTGRIKGSEALIRWFHPTRGPVPPMDFIPIAERTDLIVPLGRYVLQRACAQVVAWIKQGLPPMEVAVNLSPAQFRHRDLLDSIKDVLDRTGIDPRLLQLEITESVAMHDVGETIEILQKLRDMGMTISIDDFGTGYSSLSYLKRFPVDKLKIDRSFIVELGQHNDSAAIVRAIINLGHGINTRVNVEGVETAEQLEFLHAHGVDEVQGFYFSKPLPPEEFAELVQGPQDWVFPHTPSGKAG